MKNLSRNTAAVLVLTLFTGLAVFSAIELGDRLLGTSMANAQTATSPAVTSSGDAQSADEYYDDGTSGYGNGYGQGSDDSGGSYADPYGYGESSGSASASGTTMTCPATGCSASSCHATQ
jgi:hypothetical protein